MKFKWKNFVSGEIEWQELAVPKHISTDNLLSEDYQSLWSSVFGAIADQSNSKDESAQDLFGLILLWLPNFPGTLVMRKISEKNVQYLLKEDLQVIDSSKLKEKRFKCVKDQPILNTTILKWTPTIPGIHPDERLDNIANEILGDLIKSIFGETNVREDIKPLLKNERLFLRTLINDYVETHADQKNSEKARTNFWRRIERASKEFSIDEKNFSTLQLRAFIAVCRLYGEVARSLNDTDIVNNLPVFEQKVFQLIQLPLIDTFGTSVLLDLPIGSIPTFQILKNFYPRSFECSIVSELISAIRLADSDDVSTETELEKIGVKFLALNRWYREEYLPYARSEDDVIRRRDRIVSLEDLDKKKGKFQKDDREEKIAIARILIKDGVVFDEFDMIENSRSPWRARLMELIEKHGITPEEIELRLTKKQHLILDMALDGLTPEKIAAKEDRTRQAIQEMLKKIGSNLIK